MATRSVLTPVHRCSAGLTCLDSCSSPATSGLKYQVADSEIHEKAVEGKPLQGTLLMRVPERYCTCKVVAYGKYQVLGCVAAMARVRVVKNA